MRFEFATATRITYGRGTIQEVSPKAAEMGRRAFLVTGSSLRGTTPVAEQLHKHGLEFTTFRVSEEPTTTIASAGVQ